MPWLSKRRYLNLSTVARTPFFGYEAGLLTYIRPLTAHRFGDAEPRWALRAPGEMLLATFDLPRGRSLARHSIRGKGLLAIIDDPVGVRRANDINSHRGTALPPPSRIAQ